MNDETYLIRMINRSINYNEITPIWTECPMQYCDFIQSIEAIKDCGNARDFVGSRDVWGTFYGDNFRLKIIKANPIK